MLTLLAKFGFADTREIAPRTLFERYPDFFYYKAEDLGVADELNTVNPVRLMTLKMYTLKVERAEVLIERSFPNGCVFPDDLPNISELLIWWIAFMKTHNGQHGYSTVRTPSSTLYKQGVLCVEFTRYEFLTVRRSYR